MTIDIEQARTNAIQMYAHLNDGKFADNLSYVMKALTELERLQKVEINNHLFTIAVGYNLALVNNKDITEKQFYEIINKHYEIAITRSDEK